MSKKKLWPEGSRDCGTCKPCIHTAERHEAKLAKCRAYREKNRSNPAWMKRRSEQTMAYYGRVGYPKKPREPGPVLAEYPFIESGADGVLSEILALVPAGLPNDIRADVCQELIVRRLEGSVITRAVVQQAISGWYRANTTFGAISLDTPGEFSRALKDRLADGSGGAG